MILCKLHLENFKRYTSFDIEFGEGLIGIIGKNGSGKSTLFEAILFALYGELRNKKFKEVIRNASASDKDAVLVELDFEFEGMAYKVIREFRGKALSANAKLYKNGELTTSGAREVTIAITKLTKMSKDAFLHTLFASQKELTSLSTLKNEDRKKMIRKLLGLEKIDFVENELIEKSRELKREQGVREDLALTCKSAEALHVKAKEKETEVSKTLYDEPKHTAKQSEYDELQKQKEKHYSIISELKEKIAKNEGEIKTLQNALENNDIQLKKVQSKKDDLQDYEKIKLSLSEFKTKLNSKIAPRISQIASQMYATITKGKYQYIEVNNDFDFFIYDEGKCYPIERFSGGEIDLANLVLRIAISKTLSELSGASSVGFLAFDEVFGSQDENRRMEILEAFHTIKEQYRQIFLISHEMEIKEMFERVVEL